MNALPALLIAGSAAIILLLGLVHLLYTFYGSKLLPRDSELHARMQEVSPVITRETTMWKAWIGFNASHSYGAILFSGVYGYLSLVHGAFLFQSSFLLSLGLLLLLGYVFLGKRYWFSVPYRGILSASVLYVLALLISWA
ncbi:MAG: LIC_13387 family protein [Pseudomonas sp.]